MWTFRNISKGRAVKILLVTNHLSETIHEPIFFLRVPNLNSIFALIKVQPPQSKPPGKYATTTLLIRIFYRTYSIILVFLGVQYASPLQSLDLSGQWVRDDLVCIETFIAISIQISSHPNRKFRFCKKRDSRVNKIRTLLDSHCILRTLKMFTYF